MKPTLTDAQIQTLYDIVRAGQEGLRPDFSNGSTIKALCRKGLAERCEAGVARYYLTEAGKEALKPSAPAPEPENLSFDLE